MGTCCRGARPLRPTAATMTVIYYLQGCLCWKEEKPRANKREASRPQSRRANFDETQYDGPDLVSFCQETLHERYMDATAKRSLNHGHTPFGRRRLPNRIQAPNH